MIITQTPLRVSFFGGGTDFASFYRQEEGCVLSSTIDKFVYVIVKERFDKKIRVGYTRTELVDRVEQIQHELARSALEITGLDSKIEIDTIADIPATGTGLASSSSVTVGILNGLYAYLNALRNHDDLARLACQIEIDQLHKPIGKQDQYIVAYGGLRFIRFLEDERVILETVNLTESERRRLGAHLMLIYTNMDRSSENVLSEQNMNINNNLSVLRDMKAMAYHGRDMIEQGDFDEFGRLLHEGWLLKKKLAHTISNSVIDEIYETALKAGAIGGKITGAGGGGFMLLYCPPEHQKRVRQALSSLIELPFQLEPFGTKVIFNLRH